MQNRVIDGQSIWDLSLQYFGSLKYAIDIISDNNLGFNTKLKSSQNITINNSNIGDNDIKNLYKFNGIVLNNAQSEAMPPNIGGDYNNDYNNDYL
jgi:hypothetical protein